MRKAPAASAHQKQTGQRREKTYTHTHTRDDGIAYILSSASAQPSGRYLRPSCAPVSGGRMFCQVSLLGRVGRILQADATQHCWENHLRLYYAWWRNGKGKSWWTGRFIYLLLLCTRNKGASQAKKSCLTHQLLIRPPFCSSIRNGIITNGGQVAFLTSKWVESPSSSGPQVANLFPLNAGVGLRGRETLIRACYCVSDGGKVMLILCHNGARGDKGK